MIVSELEDSTSGISVYFYVSELNGKFYVITNPIHRRNGTEFFDGRFNGREYKMQQDAKAAVSRFTMQEMVWNEVKI